MTIKSTPDMHGRHVSVGSKVMFFFDKVKYHGSIKTFIFEEGKLFAWVEHIHPKLSSRWVEPRRLALDTEQ